MILAARVQSPRSTAAGPFGAVLLGLAVCGLGTSAARADCNADFAAMMSKRMTEIGALNAISKAHGGKLDPISGCPRLRTLAAAEGEVVAYMTKNKEWCNIPDDVVSRMTATHAKTIGFAAKACSIAVKVKQMQAEAQKQQNQPAAAAEQTIKLPTGPL